MPHSYAPQFRAMVVDQVLAGRRVAEVAAAVDVGEATVYRWVRPERIDRGELVGTSTADNTQLQAARRRIAELESELAIVRRASALFDEGRVVRPKAVFGIVSTLATEGHGTKRVCRLLHVAPSGFFRWRSQPPSDRAIRRAWLADVIVEIHERRDEPTDGAASEPSWPTTTPRWSTRSSSGRSWPSGASAACRPAARADRTLSTG